MSRRFALLLLSIAIVPAVRAQSTKPTVAVMYFDNGALGKQQHEDFEPLTKGMADLLITELAVDTSIRVVERDQLQKLIDEQNIDPKHVSQETVVHLGKLLGAHHMIFGGFIADQHGRLVLTTRAVDVETSQVEYTARVTGNADNPLVLVSQLADTLIRGMKLPAMDVKTHEARAVETKKVPFETVMLYSRGLAEEDKGNRGKAVEYYKASLSKFPDYEPSKKRLATLDPSSNG